jgi:hypothetical protein
MIAWFTADHQAALTNYPLGQRPCLKSATT